MFKKIFAFFDRLEDKVRVKLSHYSMLYAVIGGVGTVLFWRGVWHMADAVSAMYFVVGNDVMQTINRPSIMDGAVSFLVGLFLLLITGLFVATFIGDHIIVSGLRKEKKMAEKTEAEVEEEVNMLKRVHDELHSFSNRLEEIEKKIDAKN